MTNQTINHIADSLTSSVNTLKTGFANGVQNAKRVAEFIRSSSAKELLRGTAIAAFVTVAGSALLTHANMHKKRTSTAPETVQSNPVDRPPHV